ncbi:hypothetical protein LTR93_011097 [Exophiala xenobiotica]|nr:hypothetical protein LTR93_011097 [Exophiala xenobiotica]
MSTSPSPYPDKALDSAHLESAGASALEPEHAAYLIQRHGTVDLIPLPSADPKDPLNWPTWKKNTQILMVAFHAMMTTFTAAAVLPAFIPFAKLYEISVTKATYLTSVQILFLGVFPLLWCPLASRYGRRPILLASVLGSFATNMGGAWCTSYGTQMTTRALTAICISPALGIGGAVATELFFAHERAQKLGWWTLMTTLGTPGGPFIMGFVVQHIGVRWIFWILAIINFCQFLRYLLLGGETLYPSHSDAASSVPATKSPTLRRIDRTPLSLSAFYSPLLLVTKASVIVPSCAYAVVFCYANIALLVETPVIFGEKFHLDAQQIGLQYIALIIGSVIGEQVSGPLSDFVQRRHRKHSQGNPQHRASPTRRLWFSYVGFLTVFIGLIVWGVRVQHAKEGVWNVTPLVGAAIAAFGNQVITTTLIAYAVDCYRDRSMDIAVLVNFVRQVWGFIGPFYLPHMFETLNLGPSAGLMCGIIAVFALVPIMVLHWFARNRNRE